MKNKILINKRKKEIEKVRKFVEWAFNDDPSIQTVIISVLRKKGKGDEFKKTNGIYFHRRDFKNLNKQEVKNGKTKRTRN